MTDPVVAYVLQSIQAQLRLLQSTHGHAAALDVATRVYRAVVADDDDGGRCAQLPPPRVTRGMAGSPPSCKGIPPPPPPRGKGMPPPPPPPGKGMPPPPPPPRKGMPPPPPPPRKGPPPPPPPGRVPPVFGAPPPPSSVALCSPSAPPPGGGTWDDFVQRKSGEAGKLECVMGRDAKVYGLRRGFGASSEEIERICRGMEYRDAEEHRVYLLFGGQELKDNGLLLSDAGISSECTVELGPDAKYARKSTSDVGPPDTGMTVYVVVGGEQRVPVDVGADYTVGDLACLARAQGHAGPVALFRSDEQYDLRRTGMTVGGVRYMCLQHDQDDGFALATSRQHVGLFVLQCRQLNIVFTCDNVSSGHFARPEAESIRDELVAAGW